jgi:hypothetical protein
MRVRGVRALVANAFFGAVELAIPSSRVLIETPMRQYIPLIYASLIAGSLGSQMSAFEELATGRIMQAEVVYSAIAVAFTTVVAGVSEAFYSSTATAMQSTRSLFAWAGLAFLSGRVLGWSLSWVIPFFTIFPLMYYGKNETGGARWWDWMSRPAEDPISWSFALILLVVGMLSLRVTPWRLKSLHRTLRKRTLISR